METKIKGALNGFFLILACFSSEISGSDSKLAARNNSPNFDRESSSIIRNRQGCRSPWSAARKAALKMFLSVDLSGAGSDRRGADVRVNIASRAFILRYPVSYQ